MGDQALLSSDPGLRRLTRHDGPLMAEFYAALTDREAYYFYPHPLDDEHAHRLAAAADETGHITLLGTEVDGDRERLNGYAFLKQAAPGEPWGFGICVRPGRQERGLGTALLARILVLAREAGVKRVLLSVHTDNQRALKLYRAHGFVRTGEFINPHQGVPQYRMEAALE